jgi:transposase InsO family protein
MIVSGGGKNWFTAQEIADLALPGMPRDKRQVNLRAKEDGWKAALDPAGLPLARARKGARGGGIEFHVSLLPATAIAELVNRGIVYVSPQTNSAAMAGAAPIPANDTANGQLWAWYDSQSERVKAEAGRRAMIIVDVDAYVAAGLSMTLSVRHAARQAGVCENTVWNWLALVDGVPMTDRLPHLAPRLKGGGKNADVDADIWQAILSDFLRFSKPSWMSCYRRAERLAASLGLTIPHARTLYRKLLAEVPQAVITANRDGKEALRRMLPAQIRSVADMHAMELVNIDGHKADVFVNWGKDAQGKDIIARPTIVAIQDVFSRKFLAWRVAQGEDMVTARLVFADLFAKWGIPKGLLSDNGRAFASKWLTGGARTRFRFKIRDEDPVGVLTALGITIHWAKPYRGQSKPIERGFRDFCDAIARHPAFEGAYTGNTPLAKPENYGDAAVDLETFCRVWDEGIAAHNAQLGRRTEMGGGQRSFDQVFAESYARSAIGKANEEQLRLALYAADQVSTDRNNGAVKVAGNLYWCSELAQLAGQKVTIRFDPEDLTRPVHVYDRAGHFLVTAPLHAATGFLDMAAAKDRQRLEKRHAKAAREATRALGLLSAAELVAKLPRYEEDALEPSVRPAATRIVRHRGQTAGALKAVSEPSQESAAPNPYSDMLGKAALRLVHNEPHQK